MKEIYLLTTTAESMVPGKGPIGRWWERLVISSLRSLARSFVGLGATLLARWKTSGNVFHRTLSD